MWNLDLSTCLARIRERDPEIGAFVHVRALTPTGAGAFDGVPFAAKDIFDTRDMPTEWGTPLQAGRRPDKDAGLIRRLRSSGAILLGKTHTTAFAYFDPAPTRNPRNLEYTPGGSSSGSAAAVAAGMVPFALGSQTQGSVLRPASFCGVVGFKPSHGLLETSGVMPFAPSLDTIGFFTVDVPDMVRLWRALGYDSAAERPRMLGALPLPPEVEPKMRAAFEAAIRKLGARVVEAPPAFPTLHLTVRTINDFEGARTHVRHRDALRGSKLGELIERGMAITEAAYKEALERMEGARREMARLYEEYPVLLWPAALGPAPRGLASTGDPRMNAPFTGLGVPAISVPMSVAQGELPLGLQMTAARGKEALLLAAALS